MAPGRRRWTTVAAGAAVLAAASTTAWAAVANGDSPETSAVGLAAAVAPGSSPTGTPSLSPSAASTRTASASPSASTSAATSPSVSPTPRVTPSASASARETASDSARGSSSTSNVDRGSSSTSSADRASSANGEKNATSKHATSAESSKVADRPAKQRARVISTGRCGASFYDEPQMTASGERFDPSAMTAAHKSLPLGSKVRVINPSNGKAVVVRINDRGPYTGGRCLDLSAAAFSAIGSTSAGVMTVKYQVLAA